MQSDPIKKPWHITIGTVPHFFSSRKYRGFVRYHRKARYAVRTVFRLQKDNVSFRWSIAPLRHGCLLVLRDVDSAHVRPKA